jgi:hypothetical protein
MQLKNADNISRRTIAAELITLFAYIIAITVTILAYIQENRALFYTNLTLLGLITIATVVFIRKNIHWVANILLIK